TLELRNGEGRSAEVEQVVDRDGAFRERRLPERWDGVGGFERDESTRALVEDVPPRVLRFASRCLHVARRGSADAPDDFAQQHGLGVLVAEHGARWEQLRRRLQIRHQAVPIQCTSAAVENIGAAVAARVGEQVLAEDGLTASAVVELRQIRGDRVLEVQRATASELVRADRQRQLARAAEREGCRLSEAAPLARDARAGGGVCSPAVDARAEDDTGYLRFLAYARRERIHARLQIYLRDILAHTVPPTIRVSTASTARTVGAWQRAIRDAFARNGCDLDGRAPLGSCTEMT